MMRRITGTGQGREVHMTLEIHQSTAEVIEGPDGGTSFPHFILHIRPDRPFNSYIMSTATASTLFHVIPR